MTSSLAYSSNAMKSAIRQVGVIGAGVIGTGVAQTAAMSGFETTVVDISPAALERTQRGIKSGLRLQRLMHGSVNSGGSIDPFDNIRFTTSIEELANAEFIVENVTENWEVKKRVYRDLNRVCKRQPVIAANTSVIPITRLASVTKFPERVVGIHFMNPVPLVGTAELIRGLRTTDETLAITRDFLAQMGKTWVEVADSPGFVSNRVLMLAINEAIFTVQERIASAADIDRVFTECFGHRMGMLATADLIGLDTVLLSLEELYSAFADPKFRPCTLLRQMVWAGQTGRKSGRGFFEYDAVY